MTIYTEDHETFRATAREFIQREVLPHSSTWEEERLVDRKAWRAAGDAGLLGISVDEAYGGASTPDYRYRFVFAEELAREGQASFSIGLAVQDDIVIPYLADLGTHEQKMRWLPGLVSGELIGAIALTEPGAGSDLQGTRATAVRDGDEWVLNGQKTFITNGIQADVVVVLARTDPAAGSRGFSLLVVERDQPGFERGRKLDKVGLAAQDTAELFFDGVRLPESHLLGEAGQGLRYLMERLPLERLSIAVSALCAAEAAYTWTLDHVFSREAFGQPLGDFQTTRFALAEIETELDLTRAYLESSVLRLNERTLCRRRRQGEMVDHRAPAAGHEPVPPAVRRLRLHARVPDRARLPGRADPDHLRRHDRDHEGDHRPRHRRATPRRPWGNATRIGMIIAADPLS